jgi:hypothetical protein
MSEVAKQQKVAPIDNAWTLVAVSGGILLLYSISRIIALQRRVRDLEARPPVDDIVMRGMIRQQVTEMVGELEQSMRARNAVKPVQPSVPVPSVQPVLPGHVPSAMTVQPVHQPVQPAPPVKETHKVEPEAPAPSPSSSVSPSPSPAKPKRKTKKIESQEI